MAFKFALFAVLCVAQVLARGPSARAKEVICQDEPNVFDEAADQMGEFGETATAAAADAYAKGHDHQTVLACFKVERVNYYKLADRLHKSMREATQEISQKLGKKSEKYLKRMEEPARNIGETLKDLPERIYVHLEKQDYSKGMEEIRVSRAITRKNARVLHGVIRDVIVENPEVADRTRELSYKVRNEAMAGGQALRDGFRKCVIEGGPKTEAEDESNSSEE